MVKTTHATLPLQLRWVIVACLLTAAGPAVAAPEAQATAPGPFSEVPRGHPAYAAMSFLEGRSLFTGHPAKTFPGTRLLTRYEFAVATQYILADLKELTSVPFRGPGGAERAFGDAAPVVTEATLRQVAVWLRALRDEFVGVLAMLGADATKHQQLLDQCLMPEPSAVRNMREALRRAFDQRTPSQAPPKAPIHQP